MQVSKIYGLSWLNGDSLSYTMSPKKKPQIQRGMRIRRVIRQRVTDVVDQSEGRAMLPKCY